MKNTAPLAHACATSDEQSQPQLQRRHLLKLLSSAPLLPLTLGPAALLAGCAGAATGPNRSGFAGASFSHMAARHWPIRRRWQPLPWLPAWKCNSTTRPPALSIGLSAILHDR